MSNESNSVVRTVINASAWSFIGILLSVGFFYWQEYRNPFNFTIELVDQFNLVEVKEKISDLKILYKNEDLLSSKKAIKVVRFNFINSGNTILQNYYDQLQPFGLRFSKSRILNAEVIQSSSENLGKNFIASFSPHPSAEYGDLYFSKLIFDQGDSVSIKVTLLQASQENLDVAPLGKLANIESLTISAAKEEEKKPVSIWTYIVVGYFGFLVFLVIVIYILEFIQTQSKKHHIKKYIKKHGPLQDAEAKIADAYLDMGNRVLSLISALLKDNYLIDLSDLVKKQGGNTATFVSVLLKPSAHVYYNLPKEIFSVDGTKVTFNEDNAKFIQTFFGDVLE